MKIIKSIEEIGFKKVKTYSIEQNLEKLSGCISLLEGQKKSCKRGTQKGQGGH